MVEVFVNSQGQLVDYEILTTPCEAMCEVVKQAIPKLTFEPAMVDGRAVDGKVIIPVKFKLEI
jgi:outer membrane biosynthesis protein TonB